MKRGDIVIAVHGEFGRPRSAVIVQADELGDTTTSVIVCTLTSELTSRLPVRPTIEPNAFNGLRGRLQIMTDKLFSVPRSRIKDRIGALDPQTADALDRALRTVLGLIR